MKKLIENNIEFFAIEQLESLKYFANKVYAWRGEGEIELTYLKSETPPKRGWFKRATLGDVLVMQK